MEALNREVPLYMHWFLIDSVYPGCSCAYRMKYYPQFDSINSQVVEQSNAALKRTKSSLSYMNKDNFFLHCTLFLWYHN